MRVVLMVVIGLLVALVAPQAQQPSDPCAGRADGPCAFPRWTPLLTKVESIRVPKTDGVGGLIEYGGTAAWVSNDGSRLVVSCWEQNGQAARGTFVDLSVPAPGGLATVLSPCTGIPESDFGKVGDPNGWLYIMRGYAEVGGRVLALVDLTYDAGNTVRRQVFAGASRATLGGPFGSSVQPGLMKGQTREVLEPWKTLLGGDTMTSTSYSSIISRASYGPALSVFNASDVTTTPFASTLLFGCPYTDGQGQILKQCDDRWQSPTTVWKYNGAEESGGAGIIPGTRTLMIVERESKGRTCYGYATRDKDLDGTPYPTKENPSPENVPWCWSLSDPLQQKGPLGYPYVMVAKLVDLADLVDVRQGRKRPWDVEPYDVVEFPGGGDGFSFGTLGTGVVNLGRCQYYATKILNQPPLSAEAVVETWAIGNCDGDDQPPPTDKDCLGVWTEQRVAGSETACVEDHGTKRRTYQVRRDFVVTRPKEGNGAECPASPVFETRSEVCDDDTPPVTSVPCEIRGVSTTPYADGDVRLTIRCDTNGAPFPTLRPGYVFSVPVKP